MYSAFGNDFASKKRVFRSSLGPKGRKLRLAFIVLVCLAWTGLVINRLVSLQITDFETWQNWAVKQHYTEIKLASERGRIFDREGRVLAMSVPAGSVYVHPRQIKDKEQVVKSLSQVLRIPAAEILSKLDTKKNFVWIARQIPRKDAASAADLKLAGVGYFMESRRVYPFGRAGSTLIGRVGLDGNGLSGLEQSMEKYLAEEGRRSRAYRDAVGNVIAIDDSKNTNFELPKGNPVSLTIDAKLQAITEEELDLAIEHTSAKRVMAVLVDSENGDILAMGQAPNRIDLNQDSIASADLLKNFLVETVYEPGSTMKPLVASAAMQEGVVSPSDMINCENGRFQYSTKLIRDVHPISTVTFEDVIVRSSNIGIAKIGDRLGSKRLYSYLRKFGFGESTELGLLGESRGILRKEETWAKIDVATHSFGQGIAVTPLQMVRAFSVLANGGNLPTLRLIRGGEAPELRRVVSTEVADKVRRMTYGVVEDEEGTGRMAAIEGVRVGGKTGTAQKARPDGRGYEAGKYVASFVGFVDGRDIGLERTLSLIVVVDEPNTKSIYGGTLAAPVFRRIMQRSLSYLSTQHELEGRPSPLQERSSEQGGLVNAHYSVR